MTSLVLLFALGATPCPHPLFPIEDGLALVYRAGKSEVPFAFYDTTKDSAGVHGKLSVKLEGRSSETTVRCGADGISLGSGGIEGLALASGMQVDVLRSDGVLLPPAEQLEPGMSWVNTVTLRIKPPASAQQAGGLKGILASSFVITTTFEKTATVVGREKVETPAGTFDAVKITNKTRASAGDAGVSDRSAESTLWLAPDVGIVKLVSGGKTELELLSIKRRTSP